MTDVWNNYCKVAKLHNFKSLSGQTVAISQSELCAFDIRTACTLLIRLVKSDILPVIIFSKVNSTLENSWNEQAYVELLAGLGLPCLRFDTDANDSCAALCRQGKVDFVLSGDGRSLLLGSTKIARYCSTDKHEFEILSTVELEKIYGMTSQHMLLVGVLTGQCSCIKTSLLSFESATKLVHDQLLEDPFERFRKKLEDSGCQDDNLNLVRSAFEESGLCVSQVLQNILCDDICDQPFSSLAWNEPNPDRIYDFLFAELSCSETAIALVGDVMVAWKRKHLDSSLAKASKIVSKRGRGDSESYEVEWKFCVKEKVHLAQSQESVIIFDKLHPALVSRFKQTRRKSKDRVKYRQLNINHLWSVRKNGRLRSCKHEKAIQVEQENKCPSCIEGAVNRVSTPVNVPGVSERLDDVTRTTPNNSQDVVEGVMRDATATPRKRKLANPGHLDAAKRRTPLVENLTETPQRPLPTACDVTHGSKYRWRKRLVFQATVKKPASVDCAMDSDDSLPDIC